MKLSPDMRLCLPKPLLVLNCISVGGTCYRITKFCAVIFQRKVQGKSILSTLCFVVTFTSKSSEITSQKMHQEI